MTVSSPGQRSTSKTACTARRPSVRDAHERLRATIRYSSASARSDRRGRADSCARVTTAIPPELLCGALTHLIDAPRPDPPRAKKMGRTILRSEWENAPAIVSWRKFKAEPGYRSSPEYADRYAVCKEQLRRYRELPPRSDLVGDAAAALARYNERQRASIARYAAVTAGVEERFSWRVIVRRFDWRGSEEEPNGDEDRAMVDITEILAFFTAVILFFVFFTWINFNSIWNAPCPVSAVNGLTCGGNGVCTLSGYCDCTYAMFSGSACDASACPGYSSASATVCNARGVCSMFMTKQDVPAACAWATPVISNGFNPRNLGWDAPGCTRELDARRAALVAAGGAVTGQQLIDIGVQGVPTCICFGMADGLACETPACPRDSEDAICSGNGNRSVALFNNATITGNGCQCLFPQSLISPAIVAVLPTAAVVQLRDRYLSALQQPVCGRFVTGSQLDPVTGLWSTAAVLVKGTLLHTTDTFFHCYCDELHYGLGCELGTCPMDDHNRACAGNGAAGAGFGALVNTTRSQNRGVPCVVNCAAGSTRCGVAPVCEPDGGLLYSSSQLCSVVQTAPAASKWRCGDGSLQPGVVPGAATVNNCGFAYQYGTLDPAWYGDARSAGSCAPSSELDVRRCFAPGGWTVAPVGPAGANVTVVLDRAAHVPANATNTTLAWFHFVVAPLGNGTSAPANATMNVTYAGLVFQFSIPGGAGAGAAAAPRTAVWGALNVSRERVELDSFVNATFAAPFLAPAPAPMAGAITIEPYDDRVALVGVPLLDTIPDAWLDFRLASAAGTVAGGGAGVLVRALGQGLSPVTANATAGYAGYGVLVTVPGAAVVATDGTALGWTTCLSQPSLCAWSVFANTTAVSPLTGATACWSGAGWVVTPPAAAQCTPAPLPPSYFQSLTMVLVARNRVPIPPAALAAAYSPLAWTVQLYGGVPAYALDVRVSAPLAFSQIEIVGGDLLEQACVCPPQSLGLGLVNRSTEDLAWYTDGTPAVVYSPESTAVAAFQFAGQPFWERGVVLGGDDRVTQIQVKGFGVSNLQTTALRPISASQFRRGLDDAPLSVYPARCPSGYLTTTDAVVTQVTEVCACTLSANGALAACSCAPAAQCACTLGAGGQDACSCGAVADAGFADALAAALGAVARGCACFAIPPTVGLDGALTTFPPAGSLVVESSTNATLLSLTADACFNVTAVLGFDPRFGGNTSLAFASSCVNASMELVVSSGAETFGSFLVVSPDVAPSTRLAAHWSPGGVPVRSVAALTYSASSNTADAPNAEQFEATYWESDAAYTVAPVWLRAQFAVPTPLTRVVVSVRSAAVHVPGVVVPVQLVVDALPVGAVEDPEDALAGWTTLGTFASAATGAPGSDVERHEVLVPAAVQAANDTALWSAVRVRSHFAMSVRELVPFVDQECACAAGALPAAQNATVQIWVAPAPPSITTESVWELVERWLATQNTSSPSCVCENACLVQTATAGIVDVSFDGVCQDAVAVGAERGCAAGLDCADCGSGRRYPASVTNVSAVGLPCYLDPLQLRFAADVAARTNPTEWRNVSDFGAAFVRSLAVPRAAVTFTARCADALCPPFTSRCPDGSCQTDPACPATRYTCQGNGCLAAQVNTRQFSCACRVGFWGVDCEIDYTTAPDTYSTSGSNVYSWATWLGPGHITEQPPFDALVPLLGVDDAEYLRLNRLWQPRTAVPGDVMNLRVKAWNGYGKVIKRTRVLSNGDVIKTTCPYAHYTSLGRYVLLEDDVKTRSTDFPYAVLEWTCYRTEVAGECEYFVWTTEISYDEAPVRAGNGECVRGPAEAALSLQRRPPCNGHGTMLPWGVCRCAIKWTTFFVTSAFTQSTVPYPVDPVTGEAVPWVWNREVNTNFRDFSGVCEARDCTVTDCSPPMGCYPGTPENGFQDRLIQCPNPFAADVGRAPPVGANRQGRCAVTLDECNAGNTFPMGVCSYRGLPRLRDYRVPDEWYCECGDPVSVSAADFTVGVSDTTQLQKNGWGGPECDVYACDDTSGLLQFSERDPVTGLAYTDLGQPTPGKWVGYCGAPIGADPDEISKWAACCGETRLERCVQIPCRFGGVDQCAGAQECLTRGGTPLVYPCNNHGLPRADGTCECTVDAATGAGFTSALAVYDHANCYGTNVCPTSPACTGPCCRVSECDASAWTTPPDTTFYDQQAEAQLALQGDDISNRTWAGFAVWSLTQRGQLLMTGTLAAALEFKAARDAAGTCICVYPNEDPAHPVCMAPYDSPADYANVAPYKKSYRAPYEFVLNASSAAAPCSAAQTFAVLTGNTFSDSTVRRVQCADYVPLAAGSVEIDFAFAREETMVVVRLHAVLTAATTFDFLNDAGDSTCESTTIIAVNQIGSWQWFTLFCTPAYYNYDFQFAQPDVYIAECTAVGSTPQGCAQWMQDTCTALGYVYNPPSALNQLRGCNSVCCVLQQAVTTVPTAYTRLVVTSTGASQMDEFRVLGYANSTNPVPSRLAEEIACRVGAHGDQQGCAASPDLLFWNAVFDSAGGGNKGYFLPGDGVTPPPACAPLRSFNTTQTSLSVPAAYAACRAAGGWPASANEAIESPSEAYSAMGAAIEAANLASGAPTTAYTTVGAADALAIPNPIMTDYIQQSCLDYGCRFRNTWGSGASFYASRSNTQYTAPTTAPQIPWTDYFATRNAPYELGLRQFPNGAGVIDTYTDTLVGCGIRVYPFVPSPTPTCNPTGSPLYLPASTPTVATGPSSYPASYSGPKENLEDLGSTIGYEIFSVHTGSFQVFGDNCLVTVTYTPPPTITAPPQVFTFDTSSPSPSHGSTNTFHNGGPFSATVPDCQDHSVIAAIGYTFQYKFQSTIPWYGVRVQTEIDTSNFVGPFVPTGVPTTNAPLAHANGWTDNQYQPMGVRMVFLRRIFPYYGQVVGSDVFMNRFPVDYPFDTTVSSCSAFGPSPHAYVDCSGTTPTIFNVLTFGTVMIASTSATWGLYPPFVASPVPILECSQCETAYATDYQWDLRPYPPSGNTWPGGISSGTPPQSNIVLYNMGDGTNGNPALFGLSGIAGTIELGKLSDGSNSNYWIYYAKAITMMDISNYKDFGPTTVAGWTRFTCGALTPNTPGPASLVGYACEWAAQYLCQFDTTQYVSLPGRVGDECGSSARAGGLAQPGLTCFAEFPAGNATLNPFGAEAWAAYVAGTLDLFLQQLYVNYDAVREFFTRTPGAWWRFPDAYARWVAGFSSQPGHTSLGVVADAYDWVNYALRVSFSVCCGHQVDVNTGVVTRRVASAQKFCDPNAPQPPPVEFNVSQLPTVMQPVPNDTDVRFMSTCGFSARPASFYTQDRFGGPTPGYAAQFSIVAATPLELTVSALATNISVYNTGKNLPSLYVFWSGSVVSGYTEIECPACVRDPVVRVWIAPINVQYSYPDPDGMIVMGEVVVPSGVGQVPYSFALGAAPQPNTTYYQVVGWDVSFVTVGALVTITNGIITDPVIVEQCRHFRGRLPKYGPPASLDSHAPDNQCILTERDRVYYGASALGTCRCDPAGGGGGASCGTPATVTRYGRLTCGGLGDGGNMARTPAGTLAPTGTAFPDDEQGAFYYTLASDGKTRSDCKPIDVGRVVRTRLDPASAFGYPATYLERNTFDQTEYVNATRNLLPQMDFSVAQTVAAGAAADVASFVTEGEVAQYLGLATAAMLPLFVDLTRNVPAADGNADWVWPSRGYPYYPIVCLQGPPFCALEVPHCATAATCGNPLPKPVSGCSTTTAPTGTPSVAPSTGPLPWTAQLCAAINVGNLLYLQFGGAYAALSDGNDVAVPTPSPAWNSGTVMIPVASVDPVFVFLWSTIASVTIADSAHSGAGCDVWNRNATLHLDVFRCPGVLTTFALYYPSNAGGTVNEMQMFAEPNRNRVAFYRYGQS